MTLATELSSVWPWLTLLQNPGPWFHLSSKWLHLVFQELNSVSSSERGVSTSFPYLARLPTSHQLIPRLCSPPSQLRFNLSTLWFLSLSSFLNKRLFHLHCPQFICLGGSTEGERGMCIRASCMVFFSNEHACPAPPPGIRTQHVVCLPAQLSFHLVSNPLSTMLTEWSLKNATLTVQPICLVIQRCPRTFRMKSKLFWKPFMCSFLLTASTSSSDTPMGTQCTQVFSTVVLTVSGTALLSLPCGYLIPSLIPFCMLVTSFKTPHLTSPGK